MSPSLPKRNLPSRLFRRIARSASVSNAHAQFGLGNVGVVAAAGGKRGQEPSPGKAAAAGSSRVFGLDLVAHLRGTGRERE